MKREQHLGMWLTAGAALLLYYLSKNGLLHESVSSSIITPDGTTVSDPTTGAPQFDMGNPATVPNEFSSAVPPIDAATGIASNSPGDPIKCSCPQGYSLWHNVNPDTYWCIPAVSLAVRGTNDFILSSLKPTALA